MIKMDNIRGLKISKEIKINEQKCIKFINLIKGKRILKWLFNIFNRKKLL